MRDNLQRFLALQWVHLAQLVNPHNLRISACLAYFFCQRQIWNRFGPDFESIAYMRGATLARLREWHDHLGRAGILRNSLRRSRRNRNSSRIFAVIVIITGAIFDELAHFDVESWNRF